MLSLQPIQAIDAAVLVEWVVAHRFLTAALLEGLRLRRSNRWRRGNPPKQGFPSVLHDPIVWTGKLMYLSIKYISYCAGPAAYSTVLKCSSIADDVQRSRMQATPIKRVRLDESDPRSLCLLPVVDRGERHGHDPCLADNAISLDSTRLGYGHIVAKQGRWTDGLHE